MGLQVIGTTRSVVGPAAVIVELAAPDRDVCSEITHRPLGRHAVRTATGIFEGKGPSAGAGEKILALGAVAYPQVTLQAFKQTRVSRNILDVLGPRKIGAIQRVVGIRRSIEGMPAARPVTDIGLSRGKTRIKSAHLDQKGVVQGGALAINDRATCQTPPIESLRLSRWRPEQEAEGDQF